MAKQTLFKSNLFFVFAVGALLQVGMPISLQAQKYFRILTPEKHVVLTLKKSKVELFLLDSFNKEPLIGRVEEVNSDALSLHVNGGIRTFFWKDIQLIRVRKGTVFNMALLSAYWVGIGIAEAFYLSKLLTIENNKNLAIYHAFFLGSTVWVPPFFFHKAQQVAYPWVDLSPQNGIWVSVFNTGL